MSDPSMSMQDQLIAENAELRARLAKADELLHAIPSGEGEILAQVSDAVIAIDSEYRLSYLNAAAERQYGVTAPDVLGRKMREIFTQRWLRPEDEAAAKTALRERGQWRGESTHLLRDGRLLAVEMSVSVFRDGAAGGTLAVVRDVTERKAMMQALQEADRLKDEFLATLAHELRNPLAPVLNAVQLLTLKGPATPELHWVRDVIHRQVRHLTRLIDDLMDVSRVNRGKIELKREQIELATAVHGAVETSRPLIDECGHILTVTLPPQPIMVDADLTRLTQVLLNLLNNAAKYTAPRGRIELTVDTVGNDVVVSVKDSGVGIAGDKLRAIFGMFSQVESSLSRSQGGLGIGLYLVKRLVEMHGGTIEARSDGLGQGSEFVVRLPISGQQQSTPASNDEQAAMVSRLRILVVDDNRDVATSLAMLLRAIGNNVHIAYDGEDAVRAAGQFRPDVAFLDIGMPKLNGYEAARAIRQQPWGHDMVLIAITGWGQQEDRKRSQEAGFDHHMIKPVDSETLMNSLTGLEAMKKLRGARAD